jgi:hypothetical protein
MKAKNKRAATKGAAPRKGSRDAARAAREAALAPGVIVKSIAGQKHDLSSYRKVKTASGNTSLDCGDGTAKKLAGMGLEDVYKHVAKELDVGVKVLKDRYSHLNPGMQRMNLGNRLRGAAAQA